MLEGLLPAGPAPSALRLMDLNMLVMLGGRERTQDEYQALLEAAGYQLARVIPIPIGSYPWHLLDARRS